MVSPLNEKNVGVWKGMLSNCVGWEIGHVEGEVGPEES